MQRAEVPESRLRSRTAWRRRSPAVATWTARAVALTGVVTTISALSPAGRRRMEIVAEIVPRTGVLSATAAAATVGVLLVLLARGLSRRKRSAWVAVVILLAAAALLHLVKGLDVEEALLAGGMCVLLLATRNQFRARGDRHGRLWAVLVGLGILASGTATGTVLLIAYPRHLAGHPPFAYRLAEAALGVIGLDGPVGFTRPPMAHFFSLLTGLFGLVAAATTVLLLLRTATGPAGLSADDEDLLRAMLAGPGDGDSLGYFALRRDKSVRFSPSGKAAVTYRVVGGVSLAAGDPLGDPEAWPAAIETWLAEARAHAWVPAVLGCGERAGEVYTRFGFDAVELGDEAILDVAGFSLQGRAMRGVRQAVGRINRAGYTLAVRRLADLDPAGRAEALAAADAFRDGEVERGFSMALSRLGDPADDCCVLVTARDADGRLRGLLHLVPWGCDGLSLDLMRGDRTADNGLTEAMVSALLDAAPGLGVRRVSLNFAVFRSVFARGERLGAGPVLRAWRWVLVQASRFWQIESLYRANAKYQPRWEPRFLCFAAARDLPVIGVAALRAEAFLVAPKLPPLRRLTGRRPFRRSAAPRLFKRSAAPRPGPLVARPRLR